MMIQISMKTRWKVLIFSKKINDWSRDFCLDYLLYANATWSRFVFIYFESTRLIIFSNIDFESSVSWFWSIKMIFFDFIDSRDRQEDQDAWKWNNLIWIKRHDNDKAQKRSDRDEIIRKSRFSDESRWIMIWKLVNDYYEIILLYKETDFSSFLNKQQ
jgi:hypothetical protein